MILFKQQSQKYLIYYDYKNREKQQIPTFKKLDPENDWYF